MTIVKLELSEELLEFVDRETTAGNYDGPAKYIEALIAQAKTGTQSLENLLLEGLESGDAIPLDADQWREIRREVEQRLSHG